MVTHAENELMTRVEGDAPLGRLMREHYWIPFGLSSNLVVGDAPTPVRLFGENFVAWRAPDGRIGFVDEQCPHRRASLLLARNEGEGLRCVYHGWKVDVSGCVVEAPTQVGRHDQFCAGVPVAHFPVHEDGGITWVWLGGGETPAFPDLPFNDEYGHEVALTISTVPANWLQGLEGGIDSVHGTILHWSFVEKSLQKNGGLTAGLEATMKASPLYETEPAAFGMRQASLRTIDDTVYARVGHFFMPLVVVVPNGIAKSTHIFCFAPVDDTTHLLFFGNFGERGISQLDLGAQREDVVPDPRNFAAVGGDRSTRWGQDRSLVDRGHATGFDRSAIDEDAAVQVSMGPVVDRTAENLSATDVAIAHSRRLLLDSIAAWQSGELPPGSARTPGGVRVPPPFDATLSPGASWRDLVPAASE
jgi:phthalate 4,5-dioxygenase oxygenase subunit